MTTNVVIEIGPGAIAAARAEDARTGAETAADGAAADRAQTGLDAAATAADRVQTGADAATATTQAGIATTKAAEAAASAELADSEGNATIALDARNTAVSAALNAAADRALTQTAAANAQSSARTLGTWAALSALTGSAAGEGAEVLDSDTGTHTDPVVGGTVANAGRYSWSASPAGWKWVGETGLSSKASRAVFGATDTFMHAAPAIGDSVNTATLVRLDARPVQSSGRVSKIKVWSETASDRMRLFVYRPDTTPEAGNTATRVFVASFPTEAGYNEVAPNVFGNVYVEPGDLVGLAGLDLLRYADAAGTIPYFHVPSTGDTVTLSSPAVVHGWGFGIEVEYDATPSLTATADIDALKEVAGRAFTGFAGTALPVGPGPIVATAHVNVAARPTEAPGMMTRFRFYSGGDGNARIVVYRSASGAPLTEGDTALKALEISVPVVAGFNDIDLTDYEIEVRQNDHIGVGGTGLLTRTKTNNDFSFFDGFLVSDSVTLGEVKTAYRFEWRIDIAYESGSAGKVSGLERRVSLLETQYFGWQDTEAFVIVWGVGQSNMAGRGGSGGQFSIPEGRGYKLSGSTLAHLADPTGTDGGTASWHTSVGPALGHTVLELTNGRVGVILVNTAIQATDIASWQEGGSSWTAAVPKWQAAIADVLAKDLNIVGCCGLMIQGERDATILTDPAEYATGVEALVEQMRATTGMGDKFQLLISQIGVDTDIPTSAAWEAIRNAQADLARTNPSISMVHAGAKYFGDRGLMRDDVHYTAVGLDEIGGAFGAAIVAMGFGSRPGGLDGDTWTPAPSLGNQVALAQQAAAEAAANAAAIQPYASRAAAEAATVPAPVNRILVTGPDGQSLAYMRAASPTGAALTTNGGTVGWNPDGEAFVDHYGETGSSDDTAVAQAAADAGYEALTFMPGKTYQIGGMITLPHSVRRVVLRGAKIIRVNNTGPVFRRICAGFGSGINSPTGGARFSRLIPVSAGDEAVVSQGDWILLRSNNLIPTQTAGSRVSVIRRVASVSSGVIRIDAPLSRTMTSGLQIYKINVAPSIEFDGGVVESESTFDTSELIELIFVEDPVFRGFSVGHNGGAAVKMIGCINGGWYDSHIYDLTDDEENGNFGYGINRSGPNRGFHFASGTVRRARHAITTTTVNSGSVPEYPTLLEFRGETEFDVWGPSIHAFDTTNPAFDTHPEGFGIVITPHATGCFGGVNIRSTDTYVMGGALIGCRREGIRATAGPSNAPASVPINARVHGTVIDVVAQDGTDGIESYGINAKVPGADIEVSGVLVRGAKVGMATVDGARIVGREVVIDCQDIAGSIGLDLAGQNSDLDGLLVSNADVGINEQATGAGNKWTRYRTENVTQREVRVPTYAATNTFELMTGDGRVLSVVNGVFSQLKKNYVLNPSFALNLSDWTNASSGTGTAVWSDGRVSLSYTDASNRGVLRQTLSIPAGAATITLDLGQSVGGAQVLCRNSGGAIVANNSVAGNGIRTIAVNPGVTDWWLDLIASGAGGAGAVIKSVSVTLD